MTPKEINILLTLRNLSLAQLARELKESRGDLSACINGHRRLSRIRRKIAGRLGMPVEELFDDSHTMAVRQLQEVA